MKKRIPALLCAGMVFLLAGGILSCGGGGGGDGDGGKNYNSLLNGSYYANKISVEGGIMSTGRVEISADGKGGGTFIVAADSDGSWGTSGSVSYSVAADRTLTFVLTVGGVPAGTYSGIASADGNMVIYGDTDLSDDGEVSLGVAQRKTEIANSAGLAGQYVFSRFGDDRSAGSEVFSSLMDVALGAGGGGVSSNMLDSRGTVTGPSFNYFVIAVAGETSLIFTDNDYFGQPSAGCDRFVVSDTALPQMTNDISLGVAMKKSQNMAETLLAGTYVLEQMGGDVSGVYMSQVELVSKGDGTGTWSALQHSGGALLSGTFVYTVASDGVLTVTLKDQSDAVLGTGQGILSADGGMVLLSDTDGADSDGEITFAIGIKK